MISLLGAADQLPQQRVANWLAFCTYQSEDSFEPAFWADQGSSRHGLLDAVPEHIANDVGKSLQLIYLRRLKIFVARERGFALFPARLKARAQFEYHGQTYRLTVTDLHVEQAYLQRGAGEYGVGLAMLCVSLGELVNGVAYRLVAAIITPADCEMKR